MYGWLLAIVEFICIHKPTTCVYYKTSFEDHDDQILANLKQNFPKCKFIDSFEIEDEKNAAFIMLGALPFSGNVTVLLQEQEKIIERIKQKITVTNALLSFTLPWNSPFYSYFDGDILPLPFAALQSTMCIIHADISKKKKYNCKAFDKQIFHYRTRTRNDKAIEKQITELFARIHNKEFIKF
jgi:hypothetical protein